MKKAFINAMFILHHNIQLQKYREKKAYGPEPQTVNLNVPSRFLSISYDF